VLRRRATNGWGIVREFYIVWRVVILSNRNSMMCCIKHTKTYVVKNLFATVASVNCRRTCDQCMRNTDCGFCYVESDAKLAVNASCLAAQRDEKGDVLFNESAYGRCHQSTLHDPLHWAYGFCPTNYAWMATFGLVLYLMFFAPGRSPL